MKPYKGYHAAVTFNEAAYLFHGEVTGIRDVVTFQGLTLDEAEKAFHDSVDDYLTWAQEDGFAPDKPVTPEQRGNPASPMPASAIIPR